MISGGPGNDRIYAGSFDTVYAGRGNDVIIRPSELVNMSGYLRVNCGPGYDDILGNSMWGIWLIPRGSGGCEDLATDYD